MADERDAVTEDAHGDGPAPPSPVTPGDEATRRVPVDEPTSTFNPFADADEADDATRAIPADEATRAIPADAAATQRVTPQIWAARARVPVDDVAPVRDPAPAEWQGETDGEERTGSWVRPVVITLIALVLLAMLGTGLWLIFNGIGRLSTPTPGNTATPSGIPAPTPTATETATPTAQSTVAGQVPIPNLTGETEAAAKQQLTAMGLTYLVVRRSVAGATPGTVTATDPGAGTMVGAGTRVTLIVASAPAPATPTRTTPPTPTRTPTKQPTPTASA
jgi:hypothetical protein